MKNIFIILLLTIVTFSDSTAQSKSNKKWKLIWSDEFNYNGLPDSSKWSYDVGGDGWGNEELQFYTKADPANVNVLDGKLFITARKQEKEGKNYTSARMVTKGKGDWLYGRIEVSAKLPKGRGTWPAIWMLPTDWKYGGWPASGEIDILEHVGYNPDTVFGSVHTKKFNHILGTQTTKGFKIRHPYDEFHIYSIEWSPVKIDFYVDQKHYLTFKNSGKGSEEWPFDKPFHLLLNVAVGGFWGGAKGIDETIFPKSMVVDYVRVYKPLH
jgi:beta-glucanase (GH16 family)